MSEAIDFWRDISSHLGVTSYVKTKQDNFINYGEKFTVTFTLWNYAPGPNWNRPRIQFKNPSLEIRATKYASPVVNGEPVASVRRDLPDDLLLPRGPNSGPGSSSIDQEMEATEATPITEEIARVRVRANLDIAAFFKIRKVETEYADIKP